jgi:hypothetical protein
MTLRITGNGAPQELLAQSTVKIRQLILGPVNISYTAWREFLESNRARVGLDVLDTYTLLAFLELEVKRNAMSL